MEFKGGTQAGRPVDKDLWACFNPHSFLRGLADLATHAEKGAKTGSAGTHSLSSHVQQV